MAAYKTKAHNSGNHKAGENSWICVSHDDFSLMRSEGKEAQNSHIMQTTKIVENVLMRIKC